jgi:hypothetical protein
MIALMDHFHPPLSEQRHWESFHSRWASAIADDLNDELLPSDYFAEVQVHVGSRVEIDVGTFDADSQAEAEGSVGTQTATLAAKTWTPTKPLLEMPAIFPDSLEVLVFSRETGPSLVGAVELVSPGNKDRAEERRAFAAKCASYLHQGVGLAVVDIVTNRHANLHNELVELLETGDEYLLSPDLLYSTAYRPRRDASQELIQIWAEELSIGQDLPTMPLALDKGIVVPLNLAATYSEACQRSRLA